MMFHHTGARIAACAMIAILSGGCILAPTAILPPLESDIERGREVAERVDAQTGLYVDPQLDAYIEAVGDRLLAGIPDNPFDYSFKVLDQIEPNAFAAPGGFVYISRGLLSLARTEDELASVIGHEIMHVGRRHSAKQLAKSRRPSLLALPGRVVGAVVSRDLGDLLASPFDTFGLAYLASYSRGHESEADRLGQDLAVKAGYDPAALATMLERIENDAELATGTRRRATFFDTHPTTPDRSKKIRSRAESLDWTPRAGIADGDEAFLGKLEGLLLGPDPAHGVFSGTRFLHPDLDIFIEMPATWNVMNTPQAVGGVSPDRKSLGFLGIAGNGGDPQANADFTVDYLREQTQMEPTRREAMEVGEWPAYLLAYTDDTGKDPASLYILWIARGTTTLKLIGVAPETRKSELRGIVDSLRPLTERERAAIPEFRLRVVEARANETIIGLTARTGNSWTPEKTAVANGVHVEHRFQDGDRVKIAILKPYAGRST